MGPKNLALALFVARDGSRQPRGLRIDVADSDWGDDTASTRSHVAAWDAASHDDEPTWPEVQARWNAQWGEQKPG